MRASLDLRRHILFGTITIQLQLEEDGSVTMSYILSGDSTATKVRHSRLTEDTVATDVAAVLAKAVPLLTPQSKSTSRPRPETVPAGFRDADELDTDQRAKAYASLRRMANAGA